MYCIGIDQSYTNCGVGISKDGVLLQATSYKPKGKTKAEKRLDFYDYLMYTIADIKQFAGVDGLVFVYERIRMHSKGFVSMPYIVATSALCGTIQEIAHEFDSPCYSVDTRAWKKAVVGTTAKQLNDKKIQPEKYHTVMWAREQAAIDSDEKDNDKCDAAAISQTWWKCRDKLKDEMK